MANTYTGVSQYAKTIRDSSYTGISKKIEIAPRIVKKAMKSLGRRCQAALLEDLGKI